MPELPEIEGYRALAEGGALRRRIAAVDAPDAWYLKRGLVAEAARSALEGRQLVAARRRGKLLLLDAALAGDGLRLDGVWVTASVRCAPPANRPTPAERDRCLPFLVEELALLGSLQVVVALGQFSYVVVARTLGLAGRPRFGHGVEARAPDGRAVICSYHPSQQNTFTGKLTASMLDGVFRRAVDLVQGS